MSSGAYARIHLLLAFIGLYIAGMLSMSHLLGMQLPCGVGSGCDLVTQDARSQFLGIPFAYYGLMGYGAIALIALIRLFAPPEKATVLNAIGYVLSGTGLVVSIALTLFSLTTLHAYCMWCIASAITMSLLFAFYAFAAIKPSTSVRQYSVYGNLSLVFVASLLLITAVGWSAQRFKAAAMTVDVNTAELGALSDSDLVPPNAHVTGPPNARFKVVMFGDLTCPVCEGAYHDLSGLMQRRHDFQLVFRHLPLEFHPLAKPAAELSEMSAEQGKFWEFVQAMYNNSASDVPELVKLAEGMGVKNAPSRLGNSSDPANVRVADDLKIAHKLGLHSTPCIFLVANGYYPEPVSFYSVATLLDNVEAQEKKGK